MPHTKLGWWSFWLMIAFVVMFIVNSAVFMAPTFNPPWGPTILPFYGISMILCGLAAGTVGLVAVTRRHEHSLLVWLTILPG